MARKVSSKEIKVKDEKLQDYELVLIFSPELAEDTLEASVAKVSQFITGNNGTVSTVEHWGRRELAYPIKHFKEGSYVLARFQMGRSLVRDLEANIIMSEDILRHLLTRADG